jgi:hypothetical protein
MGKQAKKKNLHRKTAGAGFEMRCMGEIIGYRLSVILSDTVPEVVSTNYTLRSRAGRFLACNLF